MERSRNRPELLAPAGNMECVEAAVQNGADAVYLGATAFSARAYAENFDEAALTQAVRRCHLYGVKVYLTLNTLLLSRELAQAAQVIGWAARAGVDGILVQDLAVYRLVRDCAPTMPLHASTQMSVHSLEGVRLLQEMGFSRAVLARELSLDEMVAIRAGTDLELEVFVQGALCMSVSGQCYCSAFFGGRSANRGSCAGSCRLPFSVCGGKSAHALSLKDNCWADYYDRLARIGVDSLKIEGRMKRPEYVAAACRCWRALAEGRAPDLDTLRRVFSRSGFTDGYASGARDASMFGTREKEDVIAADEALLRPLRQSYQKPRAILPLNLRLRVKRDAPARLSACCSGAEETIVVGETPQPARARPLTRADAAENLFKLGGTVFFPGCLEADIDEGLALPKSQLNALRREAVRRLEQALAARPEIPFTPSLSALSAPAPAKKQARWGRFTSLRQLPQNWAELFDLAVLPAGELLGAPDSLLSQADRLAAEAPRVLYGKEEKAFAEDLCEIKRRGISRLLIHGLGQLRQGREQGFTLLGSPFLNITNSLAAEEYRRLGVKTLLLSPELQAAGLRELAGADTAFVCAGRFPLMLFRVCPVRAKIGCAACGGHAFLTDRTGARFAVQCHKKRFEEMLNAVPLWVGDKKADFAGHGAAMFWFTVESAEECREILSRWERGEAAPGKFTRGLYYRGFATR